MKKIKLSLEQAKKMFINSDCDVHNSAVSDVLARNFTSAEGGWLKASGTVSWEKGNKDD